MLAAEPQQPALHGIFDCLTGFSRVAVAVSGGSDSMALLLLALHWKQMLHGPREVVALTVDHGLRQESAAEAEQVATWCAERGVAHVVLPWRGEKPTSGIQAKARVARYDLLAAWCRANQFPALLTGHTADDQAETVLMRQMRTSSDRSLAGIWPENEWHGTKLLRPLLVVRRESLRAFLRAEEQPWLEDPSNENQLFERVRVRQALQDEDVLPLAAEAEAAQQRVMQLDSRARDWISRQVHVDDYAVLRMSRALLAMEAADVQLAVISWSIAAAGAGDGLERGLAEAIVQWLAAGRESRRSVHGAVVSARRHVVEVMREPGRIRDRFACVGETGQLVFDSRFAVVAPADAQVGPMGVKPLLKRPKDVPGLAFSALPVVRLADGTLICPVKNIVKGVSATLCERFRL